jgi:hypothetical protein
VDGFIVTGTQRQFKAGRRNGIYDKTAGATTIRRQHMQPRALRLLPLFALVATILSPAEAAYKSVVLADVPAVRQKPDFCGEACAEMYLRKLGRKITQDQVFNISGLDPALGRGC